MLQWSGRGWEVYKNGKSHLCGRGPQFRSTKPRRGNPVMSQDPCLAWERRENCLIDLESVPHASYLVIHVIFKMKNAAYAFLSLLMYDRSSTMLYFCQRHFNSNTFLSSIFIIDLITKLLIWTFFERKGLPSTTLLPSLWYFNSYVWK